MISAKVAQISRLLKRYDSELYPKQFRDGGIGIMRKKRRWDFYRNTDGSVLWSSFEDDHLVLPITDNWQATGSPVDWGIEPILWKIQELDGWRDDGDYERFVKNRQRIKENKERERRNEMQALAYDCRRDFARATNDINTSTLEKTEKRRSIWPS